MTKNVTWFVDANSDPLRDPFESRSKRLLGQCAVCGRAVEHVIPENPFGSLIMGIWIPPLPDEAEVIRAERSADIERYTKLKESAGDCECGHDFDEEHFW